MDYNLVGIERINKNNFNDECYEEKKKAELTVNEAET